MSENLLCGVFRGHKNIKLMNNLKVAVADTQKLSVEKH
jgi:hypothetical protein